ncbi:unnamed protein product [Parajaminaea phylloscopi]
MQFPLDGISGFSVEENLHIHRRMKRTHADGSSSLRKTSDATQSPFLGPRNTLQSGVSPVSFYGTSSSGSAARKVPTLQFRATVPNSRPPWKDQPPPLQHRDASQSSSRRISAGSNAQQAIELPDSDSSEGEGPAPETTRLNSPESEPLHRSRLPEAAEPTYGGRSKEQTSKLASPEAPRPATGKRKQLAVESTPVEHFHLGISSKRQRNAVRSSPPSESSADPIDLLASESPARPAGPLQEPWRLQRIQRLGNTVMTLGTSAKDAGSSGKSKTSQETIALELLTIGDKYAFERDCRPSISFAGGERSLTVAWTDTKDDEATTFELHVADLENFVGQEKAEPKYLIMVFRPKPDTRTSRSMCEVLPLYDPKSSESSICLRAQPNEGTHWSSFVTWLRSSTRKGVGSWCPAAGIVTLLDRHTSVPLRRARLRREEKDKHAHQGGSPNSALRRVTPTSPVSPSCSRVSRVSQMRPRSQGTAHPTRFEGDNPLSDDKEKKPMTSYSPRDDPARPKARPLVPSKKEPERPPFDAKVPATKSSPDDLGKHWTSRSSSRLPLRTVMTRQTSRSGGLHLPPKEELGTPTAARLARTTDALKLRFPLVGPGSVSVFESDCDRLLEGEFLNDTIVEFGLKYHLESLRVRDAALFESLYVFNTFFYRQLHQSKKHPDECYAQVRKWTTKFDIFAKDYLVMPINENLHWYLAIIVNPAQALKFTGDSEGRDVAEAARAIRTRSRGSSSSPNRAQSSDEDVAASPAGKELRRGVDKGKEPERATQKDHASEVARRSLVDRNFQRSYSELSIQETKGPEGPIAQEDARSEDSFTALADLDVDTPSQISHVFGQYAAAASQMPMSSVSGGRRSPDAMLVDAQNDSATNIENAGRGGIIGGGLGANGSTSANQLSPPLPRKKPAAIVPGESMQKRMSLSPPQSFAQTQSSRPRARPLGMMRKSLETANGIQIGAGVEQRPTTNKAVSDRFNASGAENSHAPKALDLSRSGPLGAFDLALDETKGLASRDTGRSKCRRSQEAIERDRQSLRDELVVLTFDSLGGKHPSVKTAAMHYLRNEAWDKRQIRIRPEARYINVPVPEQNNFADCGLFVLLYFERFFRAPQIFKDEIIPHRDASDSRWGAETASRARKSWRSVIDDLSAEWSRKQALEEPKHSEADEHEDDEGPIEVPGIKQPSEEKDATSDKQEEQSPTKSPGRSPESKATAASPEQPKDPDKRADVVQASNEASTDVTLSKSGEASQQSVQYMSQWPSLQP